jgi:dipeptidyl aminopeptidase/acylaminoacyl peptidase
MTGDEIYFLRTSGDAAQLVKVDVSPRIGEPASSPAVLLSGLAAVDFDLFEENGRILYARSNESSNLWLVEPRASGEAEVTQLTTGTAGKWNPSVSPDGQEIAFQMNTGPVPNIHVLSLEGGAKKQITHLQSGAECPAWSPDGSEIAFWSMEGGKARVWKVAADGETPQLYPDTDVSTSQCLSWAPGEKILYPRPGNRNFHQLDPDTGEEIPLVSNEDVGWIFYPHYSLDGTKVALHWNRSGRGLWVISLTDGEQKPVGERVGLRVLGWSPDEEWIYGFRGNSSQVIRYSLADHSAVVVATIECGTNVSSVSMTPDARRFVYVCDEEQSDLWIAENVDLAGEVDD